MLLELNVKDESDFKESAERVSSSRCECAQIEMLNLLLSSNEFYFQLCAFNQIQTQFIVSWLIFYIARSVGLAMEQGIGKYF